MIAMAERPIVTENRAAIAAASGLIPARLRREVSERRGIGSAVVGFGWGRVAPPPGR